MYHQSGHPYAHPQPTPPLHQQQHQQQPPPPPYPWPPYPQAPVGAPPAQQPPSPLYQAYPYYPRPSSSHFDSGHPPTSYPLAGVPTIPLSPSIATPVSIPPTSSFDNNALYKAEMSESQIQNWQHSRQQQNIKVEVPSSAVQPTPPSSSSSSGYNKQHSSDVYAQLQPQPQRQDQLPALQSRQSGAFGGVLPSPQPSWNQSSGTNGMSPISAPGPYPGFVASPPNTNFPFGPTPVEHQSSLTESAGSIQSSVQESSLTTLDPAPSASTGINARISRPYSSSQYQPEPQVRHGPSAIEEQSSLTEIGAAAGSTQVNFGITTSGQVGSSCPTSFQNPGHRHNSQSLNASSIEEQSSLTEVDSMPFPIEAQSSLTELDNTPYTLEEQSALTELDDMPHPLENQSALTTLDDLPHGLKEQSALTEIDNLPNGLSDQSSLTTLDEPKTSPSNSVKAKDGITPPPTRVLSTTDATLATFSATNVVTEETVSVSSAISPDIRAFADTTASTFSMSNWTLPTDFMNPSVPQADAAREVSEMATESSSETGSFRRRSPTTMQTGADLEETRPRPTPPPKPASLTAARQNNPQTGLSGTQLTMSEEVYLGQIPTPPTDDRVVLVPFQDESLHDNDREDIGEGEDEDEEEDELDISPLDNVSDFIRVLQSDLSKSLSRSGSGSSSLQESTRFNEVKRTDSSSSRVSGSGKVYEMPLDQSRVEEVVIEQQDDLQNGELQQLEATQFEWTFTESEQTTYERIFSLWERPAEECVTSDIAGKVFMTLGLRNQDLPKIWQLLNPEEKPILSRTQFIAGLHLVNCKAVGYELPEDLPDELMISAASVGRVTIPPRPVQGPSSFLPNYVEPTTAMNPPNEQPIPSTIAYAQNLAPTPSAGSNFMDAYNIPDSAYKAVTLSPIANNLAQRPADMDFHAGNTQQEQQYQLQQQYSLPDPAPSQFLQQYSLPDPAPSQFSQQYVPSQFSQQYQPSMLGLVDDRSVVSPPSPSPRPANSSSKPPPPEKVVTPPKPGPHALHDLPEGAPVFVNEGDSLILQMRDIQNSNQSPPAYVTSDSVPASSDLASNTSSATVVTSSAINSRHHIDNPELYASAPDAWDYDGAPPELDVEGNNIRYRTDFKNDMVVSASVTANHPINPKSKVFYFEITIDQFKEVKGSAISVGIASKSLRKNCQVGWDLDSWGYHSDDGFLYFGNGKQNIKYAYEYKENDVVGCGVNFLDRAVFFTLNGDMLGVAFRFIKDTIPLYPAIGLSHAGTEINANFGDQTFLFNILDYKKRVMSKPIQSPLLITWNNGSKNEKVFQVLPDCLSVIANGKDAGCIRGPKVSPRDKDVFYFEITILYMPATENGTIMVGICGKDQDMKDCLGWRSNSYGYSSESGDFFSRSSNRSSLNAPSQSGKMRARARGPPFRAGSVVGCGVDFASRELFFTLNGECLGQAFYDVDVLDCFPCVSVVDGGSGVGGPLTQLWEQPGLKDSSAARLTKTSSSETSDDRIGFEFKANFGQYPFMFDLPGFEASGGQ